jgi:hypothetical protein
MGDWISGLDQVTGTFPLWAAGAALILVLIVGLIAHRWAGTRTAIAALSRVAVVLIVAGTAWAFIHQSSLRDRASERRAFDARAMELTARAITPGSALACLDALAGDMVENACENAVFASAETAASALSYIAARLALLADAAAYADQRDPSYEAVLADWRRKLEADRFGLVAQVMATRDGCSGDQCETFRLLRDTSRVGANLKEGAFDQHVTRHAAAWGSRAGMPVAATNAPGAAASAPPSVPSLAASSTSGPIFPSSASIPPVSIMNAEPTGPVLQGQPATTAPTAPSAATAAAGPIVNPPTPPRRPPRQPASPAAAPAAGPPPPAQ